MEHCIYHMAKSSPKVAKYSSIQNLQSTLIKAENIVKCLQY